MLDKFPTRPVTIAVACFLLGLAAVFLLAGYSPLEEGSPPGDGEADQHFPLGRVELTPCDQQQPGEIALLGRLAPGKTTATLLADGYGSARAIDGAENRLVVVRPPADSFEAHRIPESTSLSKSGFLLAQTLDLSLRSCDYRLSDNPRASAIAKTATAAMVQQGLLTQEQIDHEGTTFQLAEDPTHPKNLFFTVVLARPFKEPPPPPGPPVSEALTPYTAVIEKDSGAVIAMGRAHWYDGQ